MADQISGRTLRKRKRVNYKSLTELSLPKARRVQNQEKLYPVEVVEREDNRVKIHYVGYDSSHDEWHEYDDIVHLTTSPDVDKTLLHPFHSMLTLGLGLRHYLD